MDVGEVRKQRLLHLIEERTEPVILIEAVAGMGKSRLLADLASRKNLSMSQDGQPLTATEGLHVWDVPKDVPIGHLPTIGSGGRLVLAKRSATRLPGLDRLLAFGTAYKLPEEILLYRAEELGIAFGERQGAEIALATGGWPLLVGAEGRREIDPAVLSRFIADEILTELPAETLVRLAMMLAGRGVTGSLPPVPLARLDVSGAWTIGGLDLAKPLADALVVEQGRRIAQQELRSSMAAASATLGFTTETILNMQRGRRVRGCRTLVGGRKRLVFPVFPRRHRLRYRSRRLSRGDEPAKRYRGTLSSASGVETW